MPSYEEVVASITGVGSRFEIVDVEVQGIPQKVFKHAPASLRDLFDGARARADETFLVFEDERWTFGEVMTRVDELAVTLVDGYGISPGDRVAVAMRNYPEWIISFAAITSIGAISVSFNAWWVTEEIDYALGDCGATLLIADTERIERALEPARSLGVALLGVRLVREFPDVDDWDDVLGHGRSMPRVELHSHDDATILYTSGTTGHPKGAVSTHGAIIQSLMAFGCRTAVATLWENPGRAADAGSNTISDASGTDSTGSKTESEALPAGRQPAKPVFILIVPLFHVTGCGPVMLSCFSSGLKLVMMYRWDPERALQLIERESVTQFVGVPTQSWDLLESPAFDTYDTSTMKKIGGGGAPAPPKLVKRVDESFSGGGPTIGYGMTETNAYGPQNSGPDYMARPTSTGRATPVMDIEVRDPLGKEVPAGELGEICFKGPMLFRGYWNRPEATAEILNDGWLHTGDIGRMDSEGFVYVEDRAKDMILRAGENVYSAEVEAAIYEHPSVYEAAVYGLPHERLGEEVAATVCARSGHGLTAADLTEYLGRHLASFKVPTAVIMVEEALPRNASGKILKKDLREMVLESRK